ncbi:MAG TPA: hypothetical protein VGF67_03290 [Ktedonobacteraceae bacterium]
MNHWSTVEQRIEWVSESLVPSAPHGLVSTRSRQSQVSRQTLDRWKEKGVHALQESLQSEPTPGKRTPAIERAVLTLLVEGHASYRGIQSCLHELLGQEMSLGTISAIVQSAGQQAPHCLEQLVPNGACALALDEQYSSTRGEASLNVGDVHRSVVWASVPPVPIDGESGTLLWWDRQEQGVQWHPTVSDRGRAIAEALKQTGALATYQRDVWHLFHLAAQVQGRVDRHDQGLQEQLETIKQQAERVAQGRKARGRAAKSDVGVHVEQLAQMRRVAEGCTYLFSELPQLLQRVVLAPRQQQGVLDSTQRQSELETVLLWLAELATQVPAALQREIGRVCNAGPSGFTSSAAVSSLSGCHPGAGHGSVGARSPPRDGVGLATPRDLGPRAPGSVGGLSPRLGCSGFLVVAGVGSGSARQQRGGKLAPHCASPPQRPAHAFGGDPGVACHAPEPSDGSSRCFTVSTVTWF